MTMILIISGVIMPAFMGLLLYFNITNQWTAVDGELTMTKTKAEAQRYVRGRTIKSPFFWIYILYTAIVIAFFASAYSNLGDWFFSL